MGRPSKFDREAAIDKVMQEVWRNGFERASVKALSERLGITRSSFYNAFDSREALLGSLARIRQLLDWAQARGEIAADADTQALAMAVQQLLAGLSVVSKVVRDEAQLWAGTALTLKGLGLLAEGGNDA